MLYDLFLHYGTGRPTAASALRVRLSESLAFLNAIKLGPL